MYCISVLRKQEEKEYQPWRTLGIATKRKDNKKIEQIES